MANRANHPRTHLLGLPAELRLKILDNLIHRPSGAHQTEQTIAAHACGFTDGVGHITLIREGDHWRSVSVAGPPAFYLLNTAVLRVCRLLHTEAMDLLYNKVLFVINMQNVRPMSSSMTGSESAIVAGSSKRSILFEWISHVHIRQHIRPEEDLVQKAQALQSLLACLNPLRKSTDVTLRFDSMWLFNDGEWPHRSRPEYVWQLYSAEMARLNLGTQPELRVSPLWIELEGIERFESLASKIGGNLNSSEYIYW